MKTGIRWLPILLLLSTGLFLLFALPLRAAPRTTIIVNSLADDTLSDTCTLRRALTAANTNTAQGACPAGSSGADVISINVTGTIVLSTTLGAFPWITETLTINGPGRADLSISGSNTIPVFSYVMPWATLSLNRLEIRNGRNPSGSGGAIFNQGALLISDVSLLNNSGEANGGAIYSGGTLTITNSVLAMNTSSGSGGAISGSGQVYISDSSFAGNTAGSGGGALNLSAGTATIRNTEMMSNTAFGGGGAIFNGYDSTAILTNLQIGKPAGRNTAGYGGGIYNTGVLTATRVAITSNRAIMIGGGGVYNYTGGVATFANSTVSDNYANPAIGIAPGGGFYVYGGSVAFVNSTCSSNKANGNGGCVWKEASGTMFLNSSTVAYNQADADLNGSGNGGGTSGGETLRNTILAGNLDGAEMGDCAGNLNSPQYSLIRHQLCSIDGSPVGNIIGQDPLLGPLANHGGAGWMHALLDGSPAIDSGDPGGCRDAQGALLTIDQRGAPRLTGPRCDIGAYEVGLLSYLPLIRRSAP